MLELEAVVVALDLMFAAFTKLAQAMAAEVCVSWRFTGTKFEAVHTSGRVSDNKAALSKEGRVRWVHAHVLVNVAITPLAYVFVASLAAPPSERMQLTLPGNTRFRSHRTKSWPLRACH